MNTSNLGLGRISIPLVTPFDEFENIELSMYEKLIDKEEDFNAIHSYMC